jgi:hypothetical protein
MLRRFTGPLLALILTVGTFGLVGCGGGAVVRYRSYPSYNNYDRGARWVPGHWVVGPYGRYWVNGHYVRRW